MMRSISDTFNQIKESHDKIENDFVAESLLLDLNKTDILEIVGLLKNPKDYSKAYIIRFVNDILKKRNILNQDASKIIDLVLKYYPLYNSKVSGISKFIGGGKTSNVFKGA